MKKIIESTKKFHNEFTKTVGAALIGAFGLVTGLAWKDVVDSYVVRFLPSAYGKVIISVAAIMIISKAVQSEQK